MYPDQFNAIKPCLPEKFDQSHVDPIADKIKRYEMKEDTLTMYESISPRDYGDTGYPTSQDRGHTSTVTIPTIRYGRNTKHLELSSNEFKKPSVTTSNAITQQCKDLRVNGTILNYLHGLNKKIDFLLGMDWIGKSFSRRINDLNNRSLFYTWLGSTGYIYCLIAHHRVYVAKLIDVLTIPTSVNGLLEFKNTLRLLVAYKAFPS
ncbi:hypothetical protein MAM1_0008d00954 [Mucor ambiguus]|uniref:Uncharacterized protein n=1 Tax=Mucor ambiguus TaxID=91626 RepID=A0A0C9M0D8_9FUNG|nr:hypothetical protein MAM1_0008d00954 [Mucor ambiguus]